MDEITREFIDQGIYESMVKLQQQTQDPKQIAKLDEDVIRWLHAEAAYNTNSNLQSQKEH